MRKSLSVCFVIGVIATVAFAQQERGKVQDKGKACSKTFTWTSGASIAPSPALVSYIHAKYNKTLVNYNTPGCNVFWGDSAPLTGGIVGAINSKECALCDGSVEITLKSCGHDLPGNDDYVVLINGNVIASGRIWSGSATPPKTLVIPLPAAKLKAALCNTHGHPPAIDFFVEDDTTVSSAKVTIRY